MANLTASELRIGNLVEYLIYDAVDERKKWYEVMEIDHDDLSILTIKNEMNQDYQPIPLTEEWLLKLGFKKERGKCYKLGKYQLYYLLYYEGYKVGELTIKYVHQLQNLYFALTGEELTLTKN